MSENSENQQPTQRRRLLQGRVVSAKQSKTVVVAVERRSMHPVYKKVVKSTKKVHAHDESDSIPEGALVRVQEHRPMSKLKRWIVVDVLDGADEDIQAAVAQNFEEA